MSHGQVLDAVVQRDRVIVAVGLIGVTALAWLYLGVDAQRMHCVTSLSHSHALRSWGVIDGLLLFTMWAIMMVAMMLPSVSPMVLLFATVNRRRQAQQRPFVPTAIFLLGYLVIWTGFSVLASLLQWVGHRTALISPTMVIASPLLGGLLFVAAGLFQFTPLKRACLVHCRTPLNFLMTEWREGIVGAFVMGLRHGTYCLGCCGFLMGLLFVAGVMNLLWVAIISAFVLIEKLAPPSGWVSRVAGWLLLGWGTVMAVGLLG